MINICKPNFSPNITMTRTGKVTLKLTEFIHLPPEFEKMVKVNNPVIHDIFKFKLGEKNTEWKPLKYFVRNEVKERKTGIYFDAPDETYKVKILVVQLVIKELWLIPESDNLYVEICSKQTK